MEHTQTTPTAPKKKPQKKKGVKARTSARVSLMDRYRNRLAARKDRNVARSTHGKWTTVAAFEAHKAQVSRGQSRPRPRRPRKLTWDHPSERLLRSTKAEQATVTND